jgi:hypothetical protein
MKKLFVLLFFPLTFAAYAQNTPAFEKGGWYLNTGFSFGYYQYGFSGTKNIKILPTTVSLEKAFSNQISAGAFLGYAKWEYLWDYNLEFISMGGRLSWHLLSQLKDWIDLDLNQSRWDIYISGLAGWEYRVADELQTHVPYGKNSKFIFGPVAGFKYFFNPNIGFYAEGGRGAFGYGTAGIGFRL